MLQLFVKDFLIIFVIFGLYNCSKNDNPVKPLDKIEIDGNLKIITMKKEYIRGSDFNDWLSVIGSIVNTTQDTFYSNMGDGFNSSLDQDNLFIAEGSDGYFEKYDSLNNIWLNMPRGLLIEGTKVISILPSKTYGLTMLTRIDSSESGKFRLLVKYYMKENSVFSTDTLRDTSNAFYIK